MAEKVRDYDREKGKLLLVVCGSHILRAVGCISGCEVNGGSGVVTCHLCSLTWQPTITYLTYLFTPG